MDLINQRPTTYIYTYSYPEDESSLCALEMRTLFGKDTTAHFLESTVQIDPSRSPFIEERIAVIYEGNHLEDIASQVEGLQVDGLTFKVIFVKNSDVAKSEKVRFKERRAIEREVGLHIQGEADLLQPERLFGIMNVNGRWVFGDYVKSEPIWYQHQKKPHSYSTSLNTRVARAVANIAVPNPVGIKAIDPCCGIGTVLVEARSMGINIVGSDRNHLIIPHVRENMAFFGLEAEVTVKDIRDITDSFDVAIIDVPYNLCSTISPEDALLLLQSARRIANKVVIVTVEDIDAMIIEAGFVVVDRALAKKGFFTRQVIVCE